MFGFRLHLACLVLVAPLWLAACTVRTPNYCDTDRGIPCTANLVCTTNHACALPDAANANRVDGAVDLASSDTPDGAADLATDGPNDRAAGDALGDRTDAAEAHTGCNVNGDCTADPNKPICERTSGLCFGCLQNIHCTDSKAGVCDTSVKTCVQCLTSNDCTDPTAPICDAKVCRGCKADSECTGIGPAVCMSHLDGHCATNDETVYVQNAPPGCSNTDVAAGSSAVPYCESQPAIDAATFGKPISADAGADAGSAAAAKALVVMRGGSLTEWSFNAADHVITVVGQSNASILASGHIGIHVSAGTVYLRGMRVSGATVSPGIVADGGELHLDRCVVAANAAGGILIDGASYDITNTIIANDGTTSTLGCGGWGGICILRVPAARSNRFLNNTVAANGQVGIACDAAYPIIGSISTGSAAGLDTTGCTFSTCCASGTPLLDPQTYHLQPGSPCIDKLAPTISTAYDIDGQSRPVGALSDCGADEYVAPTP